MWKRPLIHRKRRLVVVFQKDLIVWKHKIPIIIKAHNINVSEGLNSVETNTSGGNIKKEVRVSEGLNSVETSNSQPLNVSYARFQKDLIVWKLSLNTTIGVITSTFQKDLIVWKPNEPVKTQWVNFSSFRRT